MQYILLLSSLHCLDMAAMQKYQAMQKYSLTCTRRISKLCTQDISDFVMGAMQKWLSSNLFCWHAPDAYLMSYAPDAYLMSYAPDAWLVW